MKYVNWQKLNAYTFLTLLLMQVTSSKVQKVLAFEKYWHFIFVLVVLTLTISLHLCSFMLLI